MAEIKQLKEGDKVIYPLTSTKAIVDEVGKRVSIPTKTSELENDEGYISEVPDTYATKADVAAAIEYAITNTLNTEV